MSNLGSQAYGKKLKKGVDWEQVLNKFIGLFGCCFWKLFWKIIFYVFRKKKLCLGIKLWETFFFLKKNVWLS